MGRRDLGRIPRSNEGLSRAPIKGTLFDERQGCYDPVFSPTQYPSWKTVRTMRHPERSGSASLLSCFFSPP